MRSNFLVHWTGKDLVRPGGSLDPDTIDSVVQQQFVDRLADILVKGFWMTTPTEKVRGAGTSRAEYRVPMLCFTEVRLSQAFEHASRYGMLGVAVERKFVLDRYGAPVFHLRNHEEERVLARMTDIWGGVMGGSAGPGRGDPKAAFNFVMSFVKNMSTENADDFKFLDEHEWRIAFTPELLEPPPRVTGSGSGAPPYRIPLRPEEVKMIVFPNSATRKMAARDGRLNAFFQVLEVPPPLLTVGECRHL